MDSNVAQFVQVLKGIHKSLFNQWSKEDYNHAVVWSEISEKKVCEMTIQEKKTLEQYFSTDVWLRNTCEPSITEKLANSRMLLFEVMLTSPFLSFDIFCWVLRDYYCRNVSLIDKEKGKRELQSMEILLLTKAQGESFFYTLSNVHSEVCKKFFELCKQTGRDNQFIGTLYYNSAECIQGRANARLLKQQWEKTLQSSKEKIDLHSKLKVSLKSNYSSIMELLCWQLLIDNDNKSLTDTCQDIIHFILDSWYESISKYSADCGLEEQWWTLHPHLLCQLIGEYELISYFFQKNITPVIISTVEYVANDEGQSNKALEVLLNLFKTMRTSNPKLYQGYEILLLELWEQVSSSSHLNTSLPIRCFFSMLLTLSPNQGEL